VDPKVALIRKLGLKILAFIVHIIQEKASVYDPETGAECTLCGKPKARVIKTARPIRSHKCQECGLVFQSVEKIIS